MKKTLLLLLALPLVFASCKKEGCMDEDAVNYDPEAGKEGACNYEPTLTVNGSNPDTVEVGSTYTDAGATATNSYGTEITVDTDLSAVNTSEVGSFQITYTASNEHGTVTATRDVEVVMGQSGWLGSWTVTNDCDMLQFPLAADPSISAGVNENEIVIDNMFTFIGGTATGTIDGQTITIPQQTINIQFGDIIFQGSGTINNIGTQIIIDYAYENTTPTIGGIGACQATYEQ